ncbi:MAG: DNA polymerase Y family protein [Gemmatimonadota bacterium]|nr:DNA polymerase Y family protein [Gemmatimonadota bacterium]
MSSEPATPSARRAPPRPAPRIPRRILAVRLPWWPTERLARRRPEARTRPFVAVGENGGRAIVEAANPLATRAGVTPGMPLADGRAIVPGLVVRPADPAADARALERLARWAGRFTPRVMPGGRDTLFLDIAGCDRLFGGEEALTASLRAALEDFGLTVRLALADTPGAAWALARHGAGDPAVVPAGAGPSGLGDALSQLPVAALRLSAGVAAALASFGLDRIHALSVMESVELVRRFGTEPVRRLRQALGFLDEPIAPLRPPPPREVRRAFAEPVSTAAGIRAAVDGLLDDLCLALSRSGEGARRLRLVCHRTDGDRRTLAVGTSRPLRGKRRLMVLFAEKLDRVEPGFGIDEIVLAADAAETLDEPQTDWSGETAGGCRTGGEEGLADLLDRLGNRFGFGSIARPAPRRSWLPERAAGRRAPLADRGDGAASWPSDRRRPLRLFSPPEPVEAVTLEPAGRPLGLRRRGRLHRVSASEGPERLECEWWREDAPRRDYYLAEDEAGRRYWLFREGGGDSCAGPAPEDASRSEGMSRWFLHGLFA